MNWNLYGRACCVLCLMCLMLVFATALAGQATGGLKILVMDGNGAQNTISREAARSISVRVLDRNNRPVPGATVIFTAPGSGPSGRFLNGSDSVIVFTNQQGIAAAQQFRANAVTGAYKIDVRAAYMGEAATMSLGQTNIATAKKSSGKLILIAAAAGGAAAAAFVAKGGGSSPSSTPSTPTPPATAPTITLLGSSVGAPR